MAVIAPTPIDAGPAVPSSADSEVTFDAAYEAFNTWEKTKLQPQANALATNVYNNALAAEEGARVAELAADRSATKAGEALSSANAAATSATNADNARVAAEAALDSFDDRYLGAKSSDPATDNDGNPVAVGALYFRTTAPIGMKVKSASGWDDAYANLSSKYDKTGGDITGQVGVVGLLTLKSPSAGVTGKLAFQEASGGAANFQIGKNDVLSNLAEITHSASGGTLAIAQSGAGTVSTVVNSTSIQEITKDGVRVLSGALGYGTGAGGTVTQATSKSTTVTLNKPSGAIWMHNASLAAGATVEFSLHNTMLTAWDGLIVNPDGFTGYAVEVAYFNAASEVVLRVTNKGATRSDSVVILFRIFKGAFA